MESSTKQTGKPPYGSFRTFWSFIDSLGTKPLPPQIDRSMFDSKSGTDQLGIVMALRAFGLIEEEGNRVKPTLVGLVTDKASRKTQLADLLRGFYPRQFEVSDQHGTEKMLLDSFTDAFDLHGDTCRKAATFFLHAAVESGIPLSENFPKVRSGPGATPGSRSRRTTKRRPPSPRQSARPNGTAATAVGVDEFTVKLRAGGTVTLSVNVGHFALSRNKEDREFVQKLMDALTSYEQGMAVDEEPAG